MITGLILGIFTLLLSIASGDLFLFWLWLAGYVSVGSALLVARSFFPRG